MDNLQQAVAFFNSESAYRLLFKEFRKKYESLGRIGGTVPVRLFSENDLDLIARFFGVSAESLLAKKSISIIGFEQQLQNTRFSGIGLKELLDAYFGETIISKKQMKRKKEEKRRELLQGLREKYPALALWMDYLGSGFGDSRWIVRMAEDETDKFAMYVDVLARAMDALPLSAERLPMFSQRVTADPHAFDLNTDLGKLFLHLLAVEYANGQDVLVPSSTEEVNELLKEFNIFRDDLLNFVTCAGFIGETIDEKVHPMWQAAVECQSVMNIPLRELVSLARVYPARGCDVWIVENSGVCSTLLDYQPGMPIICTNGQFKSAALMLMDLLVNEECTLHYAGDFDPEGLGMAQRLLERYPANAKLWRMDVEAYRKSKPSKLLSSERLEKLNRITEPTLKLVADEMQEIGKAGYQEALVEVMVKDIRRV